MIVSAEVLTASEARVLEMVSYISFGELGPFEILAGQKDQVRHISRKQMRFVDLLREHQAINKIVIHQGEVQYLEITGKKDNIPYIKKIKVD